MAGRGCQQTMIGPCQYYLTSYRDIDEIVLTYVISILEDLVEESDPGQAFDSVSFMEMIVAYLPLLEGVDVSA